jgi:hypothetical protein
MLLAICTTGSSALRNVLDFSKTPVVSFSQVDVILISTHDYVLALILPGGDTSVWL